MPARPIAAAPPTRPCKDIMATITSLGIGSGLDANSIVPQLVAL